MANKKSTATRIKENVETFHRPVEDPEIFKQMKTDLVPVATRIRPAERTRLQRHFESRGLKLAQGLRMIVSEWMQKNRV